MLDGRLDRRGVNVYVRPTSPYVTGPVGKAVQFNNMTAVSHCWPLIDSTNTDTCSSSSLSNRPSVTATVFTGSVTGTVVTGSVTGTVFTGSITGTVFTGSITGTVVTGSITGTVFTGSITGTVFTGSITGTGSLAL